MTPGRLPYDTPPLEDTIIRETASEVSVCLGATIADSSSNDRSSPVKEQPDQGLTGRNL
jgi:hypothetical protein